MNNYKTKTKSQDNILDKLQLLGKFKKHSNEIHLSKLTVEIRNTFNDYLDIREFRKVNDEQVMPYAGVTIPFTNIKDLQEFLHKVNDLILSDAAIEDIENATVEINKGSDKVFFSYKEYVGHKYIDIRQFYKKIDKETQVESYSPTKKGTTIPLEIISLFIEELDKIIESNNIKGDF